MPDKNIFCNSPWYELHIYWDGSLGFCCQENHRLYPMSDSHIFNIQNMTIAEWFDSEPMRRARLAMHGKDRVSLCKLCQLEETHNASSRRHRCNQKSVIFTQGNFEQSYQQSPGFDKFEYSLHNHGAYDGMPIDLHIDLGNYCNLTCKMCTPESSSSIAVQQLKWGIQSAKKFIGADWTRDKTVWERTLKEIANIKKLHNVHFMGGETLITSRFNDFLDFMIEYNRTDLNLSFVTNGTVYDEQLIDKLKKFKRVGIEVSIESLTEHNRYQRQGTDTDLVLSNIEKYLEHCDDTNITLVLRPTISALTIGSYHTLLKYAYEKKIIVKSIIVLEPAFLNPSVLPNNAKELYKNVYVKLKSQWGIKDGYCQQDYNESDPGQVEKIIANQIDQCISLLESSSDNYHLFGTLVDHCRRWDLVHQYNALELYPELQDEFKKHGY